ncbi:MAG: regulatory protein RecX [Coprococcus sp.]|nr:regulatory protein RecX [Coprococcus sp.]
MEVTRIEPVTKTKYKIYIDEQPAFVLYKGELRRFRLKEQETISEETIRIIKEQILLKRAKLRALHLLNDMARTECQLRDKLKKNGYPEDIVDKVLDYVKSFGYINDEAYIRSFIQSKKEKKSRRELYALLAQKGLDRETVGRILEEVYEDHTEEEAVLEVLRKKRWNQEEADDKQKQKMYAYLARKGFRHEDICRAMQVSLPNA